MSSVRCSPRVFESAFVGETARHGCKKRQPCHPKELFLSKATRQTLYSTPAEIYRALIEATAFGALTIINRLEEYGVKVRQIVNCGGIAEKSPLAMQIYADVTGRPMKVSRSAQTCALGAAMAGAVVAGRRAGGHANFAAARKAMTGVKPTVFQPNAKAHAVYKQLYSLYRQLHDAFGTRDWRGSLYPVMKQLLAIRNKVRS